MRKIAVAMAKGGVGKTTTAVNLAHGLAMKGYRVLLVDCDTQGQTAKFLGITPPHGLYEFITGKDAHGRPVDRRDTIAPARPNLWLLGGGIGLVELKHWLGEQPRDIRQRILAQALVPRDGALDYLIFDCAPGWDVLSVNILMAATEVLCPVALQGPALEGLKTFFGYLMSAQRLNQDLELKYVLPTMFDRRTRQSALIHRKLQKLFRKQICAPIHYNVRLSEAPSRGQSIFEYRQKAVGATDYAKLVGRIANGERPQEST
ncbi:MAG: ParA family protein [Desulfosarcina sp.]|nr:ParA family protein [Desulfobacterales bacterium]